MVVTRSKIVSLLITCMSLDPGHRHRPTRSLNTSDSNDMKKPQDSFTSPESDDKKLKQPLRSSSSGQSSSSRRTPLILALLCAFGFYLLIQGQHSGLPRAYALCSKEGDIYTVDPNTPRAECVVVHDSRIISVGTIGALSFTWLDIYESKACIRRGDSKAFWGY